MIRKSVECGNENPGPVVDGENVAASRRDNGIGFAVSPHRLATAVARGHVKLAKPVL